MVFWKHARNAKLTLIANDDASIAFVDHKQNKQKEQEE